MKHDDAAHRTVLVIAGPTASGKTAASLRLATHATIEIVNADARQIYRDMDIGTGKATAEEQAQVRHHMLDVASPSMPYSAARYAQEARAAIATIAADVLPVVVGGSGLYVSALMDGFSEDLAETSVQARQHVRDLLAERGRQGLYALLAEVDPAAAAKYSDANPSRVVRALEYYYTTGRTFASTWGSPRNAAPYHARYVCIEMPRQELYARIDERCHWMWHNGLVQETQHLLSLDTPPDAPWRTTVGYAQACEYIQGTMDASTALESMKQATRRYAKRQQTWLRRDTRYDWCTPATIDDRIEQILGYFRSTF